MKTSTVASQPARSSTAGRVAEKRAKHPLLTEKRWMAQVIALARMLGYRVYHTWDSRHSQGGFPDLVLVRRPRVIFAELKREDGRVTREQQAWIDELRACGQEVHIWRPSDLETIVRVLR